jgi:hypothetical protein
LPAETSPELFFLNHTKQRPSDPVKKTRSSVVCRYREKVSEDTFSDSDIFKTQSRGRVGKRGSPGGR